MSVSALRIRPLDATQTQVMGVLNVTPDSFSDGGRHWALEDALAGGVRLAAEGAALLDVGGESTRPGADPVDPAEEARRVVAVLRALRETLPETPLSIDTRRASVAEAALVAGADLVNDVSGLSDPELAAVCAAHGAPLMIGHMQGTPATMQQAPRYADVVAEVYEVLARACERARAAGVEEVWVDPGIGFGKTVEHNLALLGHLARFRALGPVAVGVSRKSLLGALLGRPVEERLAGGLGAAVWCALAGASLIRTHDVAETRDALRVAAAIRAAAPAGWEVARVR